MTRCKVVCTEVSKQQGWKPENPFIYKAVFVPVTGSSEENLKFFAATPTGRLELGVIKDYHFTPGKCYYVDFTEEEA